MSTLYDKSVRELMKDMIPAMGITEGQEFTKAQVQAWFKDKYPKIKDGTISAHLLRFSVNAPSRVHYGAKPVEDDVFYQLDGSRFRLYIKQLDPSPIYHKKLVATTDEAPEEEETQTNEFAYEKDLQNFLAKNLGLLEEGLTLFEDDGIRGIEFPVGGRFIDILALDKNQDLVVIELKVSKGYDRVVGQLLRYMGWIKKNQAEPTQKVRGFIVARDISQDLLLACSGLAGVQLFEYELSITLKDVSS